MTRIHFDAHCKSCKSDVVILEGNPMVCPLCHADIKVEYVTLEQYLGAIETENPAPVSKDREK